MKYVLLQTNIGEQIRIVDNNTFIGRKTVANLCMRGYETVGYIESEQSPVRLMNGFNKNKDDKLDQRDLKLWNIRKILNDEYVNNGDSISQGSVNDGTPD